MAVSLIVGKTRFTMQRAREAEALAALKKAGKDIDLSGHLAKTKTLDAALETLGWTLRRNHTGDVRGISAEDMRKAAEDVAVLETLAPFVDAGSFVELNFDSSDEPTRYKFTGKALRSVAIESIDAQEDVLEFEDDANTPKEKTKSFAELRPTMPKVRRNYAIDDSFSVGEWIDHKKFGTGYVLAQPGRGKIAVLFEGGERSLICG